MHIIPEWEIKIPAPKKDIIWAQDRDTPIATVLGMKEPADISISTRNCWSFRPMYLLLGGGSYTSVGSTGLITQNSGSVKSFALHCNINGSERAISGCAMNEVSLNIPKEGGNIFWDWSALGADYDSVGAGTKPTTITRSLRTDQGSYKLYSGGNAIPDIFQGGKLTFKNNLNTEVPDLENRRIYEPSLGNLEVTAEFDFRIDTNDTFLRAYEKGLTGIFDLKFSMTGGIGLGGVGTGCVIDITGLQLNPEGFSEPVPTATVGIVQQTVSFVQSEDFELNSIQVTGVDFS